MALANAQAQLTALEQQRPAICQQLVALRLANLAPDYLEVRLNFADLSVRYRALKAAYLAWDVPDADPPPALAANRVAYSQLDALQQEQNRLSAMGIDPKILPLMPTDAAPALRSQTHGQPQATDFWE